MKKTLLALIFVSLTLTGCGKQGDSSAPVLPKITYADAPAVTAPPTPVPTERPVVDAEDIPSQITELYIMDEGYSANAVAGLGNTLLAADLDEAEYQLVLARYRLSGGGTVELTDRTVLLQGPQAEDAYLSEIRGISAGPDGCYYVLTGEPARKALHVNMETNDYTISENPDYSGKFRVLKYSADGELLGSMDVSGLPIDATLLFTACDGGKLLIFGAEHMPESEWKNEFDFCTTKSTSVFVLDFNTGEYKAFPYGTACIYSACPWGDSVLVFAEVDGAPPSLSFCRFDLNTGEIEKIVWPYAFGAAESTHIPFCFLDSDRFIVNNQVYYCLVDPNTFEFEPILNSIPENITAPIPEYPDLLEYPQFSTCCRLGEKTFVGAVGSGSEALYVVSPA